MSIVKNLEFWLQQPNPPAEGGNTPPANGGLTPPATPIVNEAYIQDAFAEILGRPASAEDVAMWLDHASAGGNMTVMFHHLRQLAALQPETPSTESTAPVEPTNPTTPTNPTVPAQPTQPVIPPTQALNRDDIQKVYLGLLGRPVSTGELTAWLDSTANPGLTIASLANQIMDTVPEYAALFGGLDRAGVVTQYFNFLFGRDPAISPEGNNYWINGGGASVPVSDLLNTFLSSMSADDRVALGNKVTVANYYSTQMDTNISADRLREILSEVDKYPASVNEAIETFDTYDASPLLALSESQLADLIRMYVAIPSRAPELGGLEFWASQYAEGRPMIEIAQAMWEAAGTKAQYPSHLSTENIIVEIYRNVLNREPDAGGLEFWSNQWVAQGPAKTLLGIINSLVNFTPADPDNMTAFETLAYKSQQVFNAKVDIAHYLAVELRNTNLDIAKSAFNGLEGHSYEVGATIELRAIQRDLALQVINDQGVGSATLDGVYDLYAAILGRIPSIEELLQAARFLGDNEDLNDYASRLWQSHEATQLYLTATTAENFISAFFQNVIGRAPSAAELISWKQEWVPGDVGHFIQEFTTFLRSPSVAGMTTVEAAQHLVDRAAFLNKHSFAKWFTESVQDQDAQLAKQLLASVTSNPASVGLAQSEAQGEDAPTPGMSLVAVINTVAEASFATFAVAHAQPNTEYTYKITGVSQSDIEESLLGSFTTNSDGAAIITIHVIADRVADGAETMVLSLPNTPLSASVIITDSSGENQAPSVTDETLTLLEGSNPVTGVLTATDPDGDDVTFAVVNPVPGFSLSEDGSYTFDPDLHPEASNLGANSGNLVINVPVQATDDLGAVGLGMVSITVTPERMAYSLTTTDTSVEEGMVREFKVVASEPVSVDTPVVFKLLPTNGTGANTGLSSTNTFDFNQGAFNPKTVVIPAGRTEAVFQINPIKDNMPELPETYMVEASVAGETLVVYGTVLDAVSPESTATTYVLTENTDEGPAFVGGQGNDLFVANSPSGNQFTLTSFDEVDGAGGVDTLRARVNGDIDTGANQMTVVQNIEKAELTATGSIEADTSDWAGLVTLQTRSSNGQILTASEGTDVSARADNLGNDALVINGGNNVGILAKGQGAGAITVGQLDAPEGDVTISAAIGAAGAQGAITVLGGKNVSISTTADNAANTTANLGYVSVTGGAGTKEVSVTQQTAAAASELVAGVTNNDVTIMDGNATSATLAGSIEQISLTNFDDASINSSALKSVALAGTGASLNIMRGSLTEPVESPLTLNLDGFDLFGPAIIDPSIAQLTINGQNADSTIGLLDTNADSIVLGGNGGIAIQNLTANDATIVSTNTAGVDIGTQLTDTAKFTGGAGDDRIHLGATKQAITMGAGDDFVSMFLDGASTIAGTVNAGAGTDTLFLSASDASKAIAANTTFGAKVTGFEKLAIGQVGSGQDLTVDLGYINFIDYVIAEGAAPSVAEITAQKSVTLTGYSAAGNTGLTIGNAVNLTINGEVYTYTNTGGAEIRDASAVATALAGVLEADAGFTADFNVAVDGAVLTITGKPGVGAFSLSYSDSDTEVGATINHNVRTYVAGEAAGRMGISNMASGGTVELLDGTEAPIEVVVQNALYGTEDALNLVLNGDSSMITSFDVANVERINLRTQDRDGVYDPGTPSVVTLEAPEATTVTVAGNHGVTFHGDLGSVTLMDGSGVVANGNSMAGLTADQKAIIAGDAGAITFVSTNTTSSVVMKGGNGNDTLISDANSTKANTLNGNAGADYLAGGRGDDVLNGGTGSDWLFGGMGRDIMTGGQGNDVFAFLKGDAVQAKRDTIQDFNANTYGNGNEGAEGTGAGDQQFWNGDVISISPDILAGHLNAEAGLVVNLINATGSAVQAHFDTVANLTDNEIAFVFDQTNQTLYGDLDGNGQIDMVVECIGVQSLTNAAIAIDLMA